jgi:DNA-directed RNA polymerase I subunit RPA1
VRTPRTHSCAQIDGTPSIENHVARAEAYFIANNDNQYLVPTSGNPIRGLIQDHVVAGVWMTCQDAFFTREEYFQLLYGALRPEEERDSNSRLVTLPPTIWKPKPLWTGKQIVRSYAIWGEKPVLTAMP